MGYPNVQINGTKKQSGYWRKHVNNSVFKRPAKAVASLLVLFGFSQTSIAEQQEAIFAGGCFWCIESDFEKLDGVSAAVSGYIGGQFANPSYKQVSSGKSGHTEAVKITFDTQTISYKELLAHFWVKIDPLDGDGQFCDRGPQYRSELFYLSGKQQQEAQQSLDQLSASGILKGSIKTRITAASTFYLAEDYHQDYYKKNPTRYNYYRWSCGRDKRLMQLWGAKKD
jgi:methionine-S-sulfoxide reductase